MTEVATIEMLRCAACRRLLAERVSVPFKLRCRCGTLHEAGLNDVDLVIDLTGVKESYRARLEITDADTYRMKLNLLDDDPSPPLG